MVQCLRGTGMGLKKQRHDWIVEREEKLDGNRSSNTQVGLKGLKNSLHTIITVPCTGLKGLEWEIEMFT